MRQHESTLCRVDGRVVPVIESLVVGRSTRTGERCRFNGYVFDDSPRKDLEVHMAPVAEDGGARPPRRGGVAHDFNNVLMINGLSETRWPSKWTVPSARTSRTAAGRRAAGLTAQLLQPQARAPTTFDLDEAIATMQLMLRRLGADIALTVEPSPEPSGLSPT